MSKTTAPMPDMGHTQCVHVLSGRQRPAGYEIEARFIAEGGDHDDPDYIFRGDLALKRIRQFREYWQDQLNLIPVSEDNSEVELIPPFDQRFKPAVDSSSYQDEPEPLEEEPLPFGPPPQLQDERINRQWREFELNCFR
jgi:hypothetical protein